MFFRNTYHPSERCINTADTTGATCPADSTENGMDSIHKKFRLPEEQRVTGTEDYKKNYFRPTHFMVHSHFPSTFFRVRSSSFVLPSSYRYEISTVAVFPSSEICALPTSNDSIFDCSPIPLAA